MDNFLHSHVILESSRFSRFSPFSKSGNKFKLCGTCQRGRPGAGTEVPVVHYRSAYLLVSTRCIND